MYRRHIWLAAGLLLAGLVASYGRAATGAEEDVLLRALNRELKRSFEALRDVEGPLR